MPRGTVNFKMMNPVSTQPRTDVPNGTDKGSQPPNMKDLVFDGGKSGNLVELADDVRVKNFRENIEKKSAPGISLNTNVDSAMAGKKRMAKPAPSKPVQPRRGFSGFKRQGGPPAARGVTAPQMPSMTPKRKEISEGIVIKEISEDIEMKGIKMTPKIQYLSDAFRATNRRAKRLGKLVNRNSKVSESLLKDQMTNPNWTPKIGAENVKRLRKYDKARGKVMDKYTAAKEANDSARENLKYGAISQRLNERIAARKNKSPDTDIETKAMSLGEKAKLAGKYVATPVAAGIIGGDIANRVQDRRNREFMEDRLPKRKNRRGEK